MLRRVYKSPATVAACVNSSFVERMQVVSVKCDHVIIPPPGENNALQLRYAVSLYDSGLDLQNVDLRRHQLSVAVRLAVCSMCSFTG